MREALLRVICMFASIFRSALSLGAFLPAGSAPAATAAPAAEPSESAAEPPAAARAPAAAERADAARPAAPSATPDPRPRSGTSPDPADHQNRNEHENDDPERHRRASPGLPGPDRRQANALDGDVPTLRDPPDDARRARQQPRAKLAVAELWRHELA